MKQRQARRRSKKSEAYVAGKLGGKVQPASGALPVAAFKRDVKTESLLVEDKTTKSKSYSLKQTDMAKLKIQARMMGRHGVYTVNFENDPKLRVFVMDESFFYELLSYYESGKHS